MSNIFKCDICGSRLQWDEVDMCQKCHEEYCSELRAMDPKSKKEILRLDNQIQEIIEQLEE